jgi:stage III sporulation protein AF
MEALGGYAKNVAVFFIFATLIGIISPSSKYKNYINLIMGFILMFIVLKPVANLLAQNSLDSIFLRASLGLDRNMLSAEKMISEDEIILDVYEEGMKEQIKQTIDARGEFETLSVSVEIDESEENFGAIKKIYLEVQRTPKKPGLIRIEPIKRKETQDDGTDGLKNFLAGFYNMSVDNINIKTLK